MDEISELRHQMRNSLNTIVVNAELLRLLASEGSDNETMTTCAGRILDECKRCAAIIGGEPANADPHSPFAK